MKIAERQGKNWKVSRTHCCSLKKKNQFFNKANLSVLQASCVFALSSVGTSSLRPDSQAYRDGATLGCAAWALHSGHCVPMGLRAVAQDQRYRQLCQPGVEVSLAEDKGSVGGQAKCPFSQGTCPCTRRGGRRGERGPLHGDLSLKDTVCIWDRNMQELFASGPHRHVVMVCSTGKPVLTEVGHSERLLRLRLHYSWR